VDGVPWLFEPLTGGQDRRLSKTITLYSHVWKNVGCNSSPGAAHVEGVEEALGKSVVCGAVGLDAGSGAGSDSETMARRYPSVEVISLDMSEGVYETRRRTEALANVHVVRGSVLSIPLKSGVCDFGYSFGVLHHTTDPRRGLEEIVRVLKPGAPVSLYLYEDHADNLWKAIPLKVVSVLRRLTTRLNTRVLSGLCYFVSPFIVIVFSIPARIMARFGPTRSLAARMPFNFGTSLFSVQADLVDRFGAPIEMRYNREGVIALLEGCGLTAIRTAKLRSSAGWVVRGEVRLSP
jgi:SAM-dependent methyltransferase